jgi:DNA-directed RNA polymerase specialized sigma24 family protein
MVDQRGPVARNSLQSQTRLTTSNRAELLAGYAAGVPVRELATRFGVHRATVSELVRRAGLEHHRHSLPDQVREEAARLYAEGLTLPQVAGRLGISNDGVRAAVVAYGGTVRRRGRRPTHV